VWVLVAAASLAAAPALAQDETADEAPEPNWTSSVGLSYVATTGNSETSSFGLDFASERKPAPWGLNLAGTFTRSEDDGELTAEQYYFGIRGLRQLNDRWSLFAGVNWARDTFSGFDNRYIAEAGAEYIAISTDRHTLSFDFGLTGTTEDQILTREVTPPVVPPLFEEYTDSVDWFGGVGGLTWNWKISDSAELNQRLLYYPNFDDSADWRLASDTAVSASLTDMLALQFSYLVRYRNEPIDNNEDTDTTTKASVVFKF
jgi:putative salt-induced outer membrane protein